MHFTYAPQPSSMELMQGDVLQRTPYINNLLKNVHPHFENSKYQFFMVLTQSCDLVLRDGTTCKAPYITIAPVRNFDDVLNKRIDSFISTRIPSELPILTDKDRSKLTEFLGRIYNNNEPGYFFLESEGTSLPNDCCALLNLSIAIKSDEHYQQCIEAKILQLENSFQAKLGWLVGQLYSRVGTEDWSPAAVKTKITSALTDVAIWVPAAQLKSLETEAKRLIEEDAESALDANSVSELLRRIPDRKQKVMSRAVEILHELMPKDEQTKSLLKKVSKRLENDLALTSFLK